MTSVTVETTRLGSWPTPVAPVTVTTAPGRERFADSEYLRQILIRVCDTPDGWRTDPEVDDLIRYAATRFTQLAVKHGLEPTDALSGVFEAMRLPSVRFGVDPWGVIVTAVATTFHAWQFAEEALTSLDTARRGGLAGCRVVRFCERDPHTWEQDPGLAVHMPVADDDDDLAGDEGPSIPEQAQILAGLFTSRGWPVAGTRIGIEIILRKLADAGSRPTAYEGLRREKRWRVICGLPGASWTGLLRLLLGSPGVQVTPLQRGVLVRWAVGETIPQLASDPHLGAAITRLAPGRGV